MLDIVIICALEVFVCVIIGWVEILYNSVRFHRSSSFASSRWNWRDESVYTMKIQQMLKLKLFVQIASFKIFIMHCVYFTHLLILIFGELFLNLSSLTHSMGYYVNTDCYQNPIGSFKKKKIIYCLDSSSSRFLISWFGDILGFFFFLSFLLNLLYIKLKTPQVSPWN